MSKSKGILVMEREKTPIDKHKYAWCKLCGEKIVTPERLLLKCNSNTYIGYVHEECMKKAYDIMLLNKV